MNRKSPSQSERYFTTGLAMITSTGTNGPNIMTAEWTMQISYKPLLIATFIHEGSQTLQNIKKSKEFGISMASQEQTTEVNIAGGYSGTELNKLEIKNTFKIIKSKKIKTPLIGGAIINAECKLVKMQKFGDHVMMVGKIVNIIHDGSKNPLIYHKGRYFSIGSQILQDRIEVNVSKDTLDFFRKIASKKFVLKCVGIIVRSKNKILVTPQLKNRLDMIPFSIPPQGVNQREHLIKFLKQSGLDIQVTHTPTMKRLILKNNGDVQRVNFVLFDAKIQKPIKYITWKESTDDNLISSLI